MSLRLPLLGFLLLALDTNWTVGIRAFGPIRFGTTVAAATRLTGDSLRFQNPGLFEGCDYVTSPALPAGTSFMVWNDSVVVRVDVTKPGVATRSGIQVGSAEAAVRAAYPGRIATIPNPYDDANPLLSFTPADRTDSAYSMVFEIADGKVTGFRAGRRDAVELAEGCA